MAMGGSELLDHAGCVLDDLSDVNSWHVQAMTAGIGPELGDAIYCLPTIKTLGIRDLYAVEVPWCRPGFHQRAKALTRLFEAQGYRWEPHHGQKIDLDLTTYRGAGNRYGETIINRIARWARVEVDISRPWLQVEPDKRSLGRIVVNRCPRWHGVNFGWKSLVQQYQRDILFIGLESEWKAFCTQFGMVGYCRTIDLLEAAQVIAGSALYISNQSSCNAICEGLHHPNILETCVTSMDCVTKRPNTIYSVTGELHATILGKEFHHAPRLPGLLWTVMVDGYPVQAPDAQLCEVMARATYVSKGLPLPTIAQIRASMVQAYQESPGSQEPRLQPS